MERGEKGLYRKIFRPEENIHHIREIRNADIAMLITAAYPFREYLPYVMDADSAHRFAVTLALLAASGAYTCVIEEFRRNNE